MRNQVVTAKAGFTCDSSLASSLDPKQPLTSRDRNTSLGFAWGQRVVNCTENSPPDNTMVSCHLRPFPWEGRSRGGEEEKRHPQLFLLSSDCFWETACVSILIFLTVQCFMFIKRSNLAIAPVYKREKKLLTFLGVFVVGL